MQKTSGFRSPAIRANQQYAAHLLFSVSVDEETGGATAQQPVTLVGYTHRIGEDALTLVGPFYHFGYRYLMGRDRTLQIELHLPNGAVNIQGFPVGYTRMSDNDFAGGYMLTGPDVASSGEADVNCLIEVSIVVMSDSDRSQLTQYLRQLNPAQTEETIAPPIVKIAQPQRSPAYVAVL